MEGYYEGTIFHRVIPGFIIQGGDPTGTGIGGEPVYGEPFQDEFNTRLKFRYRGIVGVANAGKGTNTNGSQFFITLDKQEFLNRTNTMFGKVVGDSLYNLVNLIEDVEVDKNDRPIGDNIPRIIRTEVLENPFDDIVPRKASTSTVLEHAENRPKKIIQKRGGSLSFISDSNHDRHKSIINQKPVTSTQEARSVVEPVMSSANPSTGTSPNKLQNEIERLKMQIQKRTAQSSTHQPAPPVGDDRSPDEKLSKKIKSWTHSLNSNVDWLSGGGLKFAVDSKTAFGSD
jgi:peptidyl-prolyl cis-trans isomerase SDCCAG10